MVSIKEGELFVFLSCTVRYALGRRSYVVQEAAELVRKYYSQLLPGEQDVIYRDTLEGIQNHAFCYEEIWTPLLKEMESMKNYGTV